MSVIHPDNTSDHIDAFCKEVEDELGFQEKRTSGLNQIMEIYDTKEVFVKEQILKMQDKILKSNELFARAMARISFN